MTTLLLTGAGGFVGSHVLRHVLANTDWDIFCPVTFRHKGKSDRIASAIENRREWSDRVHVRIWDLATPPQWPMIGELVDVDYIWNIASESHVDRSIAYPGAFIRNNIDLMLNILELARFIKPKLFLQMSTDEVFGPAYGDHRHTEWDPHCPSNPYSASKAAQEAIAISYWRTYGLPLIITNTMNIIGEMQDPEKFVPMTIRKLHRGEAVQVHASPEGTPGSRFYLHARNLADAWLFLTRKFGESKQANARLYYGEDTPSKPTRFNIVGEREVDNIEMVRLIQHYMDPLMLRQPDVDAPEPYIELVDFHSSRPGHDLRYALDGSTIADLGWKPPIPFEESLRRTVRWTLDHPEWMDAE